MEQISIRSLQHFLYCPHRWGLIEIDRSWAENYFVTKGNIAHKRVHSGENYSLRGAKILTSVKVWNDQYGLSGETDVIEIRNGKYAIVEYKPSSPKDCAFQEPDALQVFAQKICVDHIFSCDSTAYMYYSDIRKRVLLPFSEQREHYQKMLESTLTEMRKFIDLGYIPPVAKSQNCTGCSMKDLCIPAAFRKHTLIRNEILKCRGNSCGNF